MMLKSSQLVYKSVSSVGECFFWYWLTWVVPDKIHKAVKRLCVCVRACVCVCVLFQPAPGATEMADPVIRVHDDLLECVTSFPYLGSHLASNTYIDSELQHRISAANCSFGKHRKRIYDSRDLSKEMKLLAYKAFVLPVLLYSA